MPTSLTVRLRRVAAAAGVGAIRDWWLDRYWIGRLTGVVSRAGRLDATTSAQPPALFHGDAVRWLQPDDRVEHDGDPALGWGRVRAAAERAETCVRPLLSGGIATSVIRYPLPSLTAAGPGEIFAAQDLIVDFSRLYPARTVAHRPRYSRGDGRQYHRFRSGALEGAGSPTEHFAIARFSADHQRNLWSAFRALPPTGRPSWDEVVDHPVLFVTREGEESRNLFHSATDFLNAYEALLVAQDGAQSVDRNDLQLVFLDNAPPAPFDALWAATFAPRRGIRRVGDFERRRVLFRRAVFSASGYHSVLLAFLTTEGPRDRIGLLDAFSGLVLRAHGLAPQSSTASARIRLTFVTRRSYDTHSYMGRQFADEDSCLRALASIPGVDARVVDFARISVDRQLAMAADTDVLVGVHGAALTHALWMPRPGGVVEIDTTGGRGWRMFRNIAYWSGHEYALAPGRERAVPGGTLVDVSPDELVASARAVIANVIARRGC